MAEKLQLGFQTQGWEQFLTSRKEMLDAYDQERVKAKSKKVQTSHGNTAESVFRRWLKDFLPKRYGVTSGYIVSQGARSSQPTPHFDVIIYDQLESPVLWVEGSPDRSDQGRSLAIPAEFVHCVLEVKANLTTSSATEGIAHLMDLLPLMSGMDSPKERYKLYLPLTFTCGLVFFELQKKNQYHKTAIQKIGANTLLRGFFGGVILRGEGHKKALTGLLRMVTSETASKKRLEKESLLSHFYWPEMTMISETQYVGCLLNWGEDHFSQFSFQLLSLIQGTYRPGYIPSFHAMGNSDWEDKVKQNEGT